VDRQIDSSEDRVRGRGRMIRALKRRSVLSGVFSGSRRWMTGLALAHALLACACGGSGSSASAADPDRPPITLQPPPPPPQLPPPAPTPDPTPECETRDVYTLCITRQVTYADPVTVEHMKERFFTVYPILVERFNRAAPLSVYFVIGPSIYVASASGNTVTYQGLWSLEHPQDYDVVVHELMHVVQSYVSSPGWLTEGIADYARYHYGVNNDAAGWHLQMPFEGSHYTDGYGVTGRFLVWVEAHYKVELVNALDSAIRSGTYEAGLWISLTGKNLDALWTEYFYDP